MACEYHILMISKSELSINRCACQKPDENSFQPPTLSIHYFYYAVSPSIFVSSLTALAHLLEQTKYYITLKEHRCPESTQARLEVYPYCLFYLNSLLDIWNSVIWSALLLYWRIRATIIICCQLYYPVYNCCQDNLHNHNIILHSQFWLLMVSVIQQTT